jgi:hypothetical protein
VTTGLFAFPYFALIDTALPGLIVLAGVVAFIFPLAALAAECFTPRLRYRAPRLASDLPRFSPPAPRR